MDGSSIVWIVVVVLVVLALAALAAAFARRRQTEARRNEAESLRTRAASDATTLEEGRVEALEAQARAERARLEAEQAQRQAAEAHQAVDVDKARYEDRIREADRIDPAVDHTHEDYAPDTTVISADQDRTTAAPLGPTTSTTADPDAPPPTGGSAPR